MRTAGLLLIALCVTGQVRAAPPAGAVSIGMAGSSIRDAGDINLVGVVLSQDSSRNIALLGLVDGPAFPFRPGEELAASWRLIEVRQASAVVADPTGARYRLTMAPEDGRARAQAAARLPPIRPMAVAEPSPMPSDEMLEHARREFNLPASD